MAQGNQGKFLTFTEGSEEYAVSLNQVWEIIEYSPLTPVPMVPEFIRGVINLRGIAVPVIDLKIRMGRGYTEIKSRTIIVVLELAMDGVRQRIGVLVDEVQTVIDLPHSEIEAAPKFGSKIHTDFIAGMARRAGKFLVILALEKIFSVDEAAILADTATQGQHAA